MTLPSADQRPADIARPPQAALAPALAVVRALSATLRRLRTDLPPDVPSRLAAEARLASGIPALIGEPLADWDTLLRNAAAVARALPAGDTATAVTPILERLEAARLRPEPDSITAVDRAAAALAGAWEPVAALAEAIDVDPDVLVTLLDYAARPALRAGAEALAPVIAAARWARGDCPACGAPATLSVVSGKEHERQLHCGRCATAWAFPRVRCPSCGERDHERLGLLHAAGEGEYRRAEICDSCRSYVKSVALLDAPGADRLLELDLETAALDFLALDRGYSRAGAPN
jgi:FdhE protein